MNTKPKNVGFYIREALLAGETQASIVRSFNVSKSTVHYHAKVLGLTIAKHIYPKHYDWNEVRNYLGTHGVRETIRHFGMNNGTWSKAKARGDVPAKSYYPESVFVPGKNRGSLKRAMKHLGTANQCSAPDCGISTWLDKPLSLHLDHIDGDKLNNNQDNLRLLCPNCHSQTDTYGGRNRNK